MRTLPMRKRHEDETAARDVTYCKLYLYATLLRAAVPRSSGILWCAWRLAWRALGWHLWYSRLDYSTSTRVQSSVLVALEPEAPQVNLDVERGLLVELVGLRQIVPHLGDDLRAREPKRLECVLLQKATRA